MQPVEEKVPSPVPMSTEEGELVSMKVTIPFFSCLCSPSLSPQSPLSHFSGLDVRFMICRLAKSPLQL